MNFNETALLIKANDNILILTHARPDGDTVGSARALCLSLRAIGKTSYVFPNEEAHELFTPYMDDLLPPNSFTPNFIIAVDTASTELLTPSAQFMSANIDLAIDHHGSNTSYAKNICLAAHFGACGELIYFIIKELGEISKQMAEALYIAIATDTGCFSFSNTSPQTHQIAAILIEIGCNFNHINKVFFRTKSKIRLQIESMLTNDMLSLDDGKLAIVALTNEMIASVNAGESDLENIASFLEIVEGVEIAVTIREIETNRFKISLRTNETLNASKVCEKLGGGGHPAAAGCKVSGTLPEVKDIIIKAIEDTRAESN